MSSSLPGTGSAGTSDRIQPWRRGAAARVRGENWRLEERRGTRLQAGSASSGRDLCIGGHGVWVVDDELREGLDEEEEEDDVWGPYVIEVKGEAA